MFKAIVSGALKKAAEGKYGAIPAKIYAFLDAHALWVSVVLSCAYACLKIGDSFFPEYGHQIAGIEQDLLMAAGLLAAGGIPVQLHASDPPSK